MAERRRSSSVSFFEVLGVDDVVIEKALHHFRDERDAMKEMQNLVGHRAKLEADYARQIGDTAKKFGLHSYYPQLNQTLANVNRVATEISNTHLNVADLLKRNSEEVGQAAADFKDRIKEHERSLGDVATEVATATKRVKEAEKMLGTKQKDLDELMDKVAAGNATKVKMKHFFSKNLKKSDDHDEKLHRLKMQKEDSLLAVSNSMKELELVVERSRGRRQTVFKNLEAEEKLRCKRIVQTFVDCLEREMELQDQRRQQMLNVIDELKALNVDEDVQAFLNVFSEKFPAAGVAAEAAVTAAAAKAPEGKRLNDIYMTIDDTSTYSFKTEGVAGKRPSLRTQIDEGFDEGAGQMRARPGLSRCQSEDATENKASRPPLTRQRTRDSVKSTESLLSRQAKTDSDEAAIALSTSPTPTPPSTIDDGPDDIYEDISVDSGLSEVSSIPSPSSAEIVEFQAPIPTTPRPKVPHPSSVDRVEAPTSFPATKPKWPKKPAASKPTESPPIYSTVHRSRPSTPQPPAEKETEAVDEAVDFYAEAGPPAKFLTVPTASADPAAPDSAATAAALASAGDTISVGESTQTRSISSEPLNNPQCIEGSDFKVPSSKEKSISSVPLKSRPQVKIPTKSNGAPTSPVPSPRPSRADNAQPTFDTCEGNQPTSAGMNPTPVQKNMVSVKAKPTPEEINPVSLEIKPAPSRVDDSANDTIYANQSPPGRRVDTDDVSSDIVSDESESIYANQLASNDGNYDDPESLYVNHDLSNQVLHATKGNNAKKSGQDETTVMKEKWRPPIKPKPNLRPDMGVKLAQQPQTFYL